MPLDLEKALGIPDGYRPGMDRSPEGGNRVTHLYTIGKDIMDFQLPMCFRGWNRDNGESYSIWRGNISNKGICLICFKRAKEGRNGVMSKAKGSDKYE